MSNEFDLESMLRSILGDDTPSMTAPPATAAPQPVVTAAVTPKSEEVFTDAATRDGADLPALSFPEFTTDEIAGTFDIRNYATMARLRMRKWHARVKDKRVARDTAKAEGASEQVFSVYRRLLAGFEEKLKTVHSAIYSARMRHYELTLPWSTTGVDESGRRDGPRLLPNTLFMEYVTIMGRAKVDMETALSDFKTAYPGLVEAAKKVQGKDFDPTVYPPVESMDDRFALEFDFEPIPMGVDFKGLPAQQIAALKDKMNETMRRRLENAMQDVWLRLHEVISHMAERLADPNKGFHDTLVSNVRETVELAKHLNATNDPILANIVDRAKQELCLHDAAVLRKDLSKREYAATCAREVLQQMAKAGRR
jgi:hypothetical protein